MDNRPWTVVNRLWSSVQKTKTSRPQWDGRKNSRGTTQIHHPERSRRTVHLVLTNISLSYNVEITFRTTNVTPDTFSREQLKRELRLVSVERGFQPMPCASLATFASVLSSVNAFIGVACYALLSAKTLPCQGFNGIPRHRRRGSQDQLRGRREFSR